MRLPWLDLAFDGFFQRVEEGKNQDTPALNRVFAIIR